MCNKQKQLKIMQGLPGAGKSTFVKNNYKKAVVCSADDYRDYSKEITYKDLELGHSKCFKKCFNSMLNKKKLIVIDNTNTKYSDFISYIDLAEMFKYEVEIVIIPCTVETSIIRNKHNVPEKAIKKMDARLKNFVYPENIKHKIVKEI